VVAIAVAAAVGAAPAAQKPARIVPTARAPVAGTPWTLTLAASKRAVRSVTLRNGISRLTFAARKAGRLRFRARVTAPYAGVWRVDARLGNRTVNAGSVRVAAGRAVPSALAGAEATRICGGTPQPLPQYALARDGNELWIGCRRTRELFRVQVGSGEVDAVVRLGLHAPYAIAAENGVVWSVDRTQLVSRIDPAGGRVRTAATLGGASAYIWAAAGSVWVADDGPQTLLRLDPATGNVLARASTGNGTSALVTAGGFAWILNHRDGTLERIDLATNAITRLSRLPGDAPERMVMLDGSLWVTGRGTDLLRVDPATGAVQATIEIGAGGIDLRAAGGHIWVFAPSLADDQQGLPYLERALRVDPESNSITSTVRPTSRVVVNGLASDDNSVWIADTAGGRLYRLPAS
jgi:virginiamycin B lyase